MYGTGQSKNENGWIIDSDHVGDVLWFLCVFCVEEMAF